ncbi:MAG: acrylyl-CoA reductase family protein [Advenella sp.]|uniref:Zinc-binding dehydrogenase n=1 Tax=Advenella kashmirensis TaxID=310575 RepID=A0A356LHS8_9BURK|nr:zinc-binding dehydrogenase [Advenella kashmirensis]
MTSFSAFRLEIPGAQTPPESHIRQLQVDDLSPGDTVIKVAFAGVNYKDALAANGQGKIVRDYPRISGIDLSGHVVSSANGQLKEGDPVVVHGFGLGVEHDGGHAQYARVSSDWVLPLPAGLSLREAATLGAAGYTAALALHWMEMCGLCPDQGEIAVTGATGGVASIAIDILNHCGYQAVAITGKHAAHDYLKKLGAARVMAVPDLAPNGPLASGQWAGAIDSVGGPVLAWLLRTTKPEGIITAFGNAGGASLSTSVFPFILRGVKLLGINAGGPMALRREIWDKLATVYRPDHLDDICQVVSLRSLPQVTKQMLERKTTGRNVIDMAL